MLAVFAYNLNVCLHLPNTNLSTLPTTRDLQVTDLLKHLALKFYGDTLCSSPF